MEQADNCAVPRCARHRPNCRSKRRHAVRFPLPVVGRDAGRRPHARRRSDRPIPTCDISPPVLHRRPRCHHSPTGRNGSSLQGQIGRAHVSTPVTNAHPVCRLLLEKKKEKKQIKEIEEKVVTKYIKINLSTKNT